MARSGKVPRSPIACGHGCQRHCHGDDGRPFPCKHRGHLDRQDARRPTIPFGENVQWDRDAAELVPRVDILRPTVALGYDGQTLDRRPGAIAARVQEPDSMKWDPTPGDPTTLRCDRKHYDLHRVEVAGNRFIPHAVLVRNSQCREVTVRQCIAALVPTAPITVRRGLLAVRLMDARSAGWRERVNRAFCSSLDEPALRSEAKAARAWLDGRLREEFEQPTSWHPRYLPVVAA